VVYSSLRNLPTERKIDLEIENAVLDLYGITLEERIHIWTELKKAQKLRIIREIM
jgi:hypothetical protein